jgi:hypothetical protein
MVYVMVIGAFILVTILYFAHPKLSPVPYFPTQKQDLNLIIKLLKLKPGAVLYDLGAGNGRVILHAVPQKNITVVGVELNPFLFFYILIKKLFHPHSKNIKLIRRSFLTTDLSPATHLYLYLSREYLAKVKQKIWQEQPTRLKTVVSYMYDLKLSQGNRHWHKKIYKGKNYIYVFTK